jgi:hypothetical protein
LTPTLTEAEPDRLSAPSRWTNYPSSNKKTDSRWLSCEENMGKNKQAPTAENRTVARKREYLTEAECEKLLEAARGNRYGLAVILAPR